MTNKRVWVVVDTATFKRGSDVELVGPGRFPGVRPTDFHYLLSILGSRFILGRSSWKIPFIAVLLIIYVYKILCFTSLLILRNE